MCVIILWSQLWFHTEMLYFLSWISNIICINQLKNTVTCPGISWLQTRWLACIGLRSKILGRGRSSNFLNKQNAQYFRIKPEMCSSLVSALLEYLASVKCDSTFLKWIWGLIKSTCVYNKWGYFYYSFYFYLQAIFAVIMQKKKPKKSPKSETPHNTWSRLSSPSYE